MVISGDSLILDAGFGQVEEEERRKIY